MTEATAALYRLADQAINTAGTPEGIEAANKDAETVRRELYILAKIKNAVDSVEYP